MDVPVQEPIMIADDLVMKWSRDQGISSHNLPRINQPMHDKSLTRCGLVASYVTYDDIDMGQCLLR